MFLITGANGYIGSKLVPHLLGEGHKLRCLVRSAEKAESLAKLGAEVVVGDITNKRRLQDLTDGIEVVYHLAGEVSESEEKAHRVNVGGTENLMEVFRDRGIRAFIFASSAAVYGDTRGETVDEDSSTAPYNAYGRSKLAAENELLDGYDDYGFPVIILRLATVYGPESPVLRQEAIRNDDFRILGSGNNWMNFVHIDDLLPILEMLPKKGKPGETYMVSDDEPVSAKNFYRLLAAKLGVLPPSHKSATLIKILVSIFNPLGRLIGMPALITPDTIKVLLSSRRLSNHKIKKDLGITLSCPTYRDGIEKTFSPSQ